jgi:hypothetical protein
MACILYLHNDSNYLKALISAQNDENFASIYNCTRALLFFGTPHRGATALEATRVSLLIGIAGLASARIPANILESLKLRAAELFRINDQFRNLSLLRENRLSLTCFYERRETPGLGDVVSKDILIIHYRKFLATSNFSDYGQVVDQDSAVLGYQGEEDVPLALSHQKLVAYSGLDDDNYYRVKGSLRIKVRPIIEQRTPQLPG